MHRNEAQTQPKIKKNKKKKLHTHIKSIHTHTHTHTQSLPGTSISTFVVRFSKGQIPFIQRGLANPGEVEVWMGHYKGRAGVVGRELAWCG